jgi:hypothetical protein
VATSLYLVFPSKGGAVVVRAIEHIIGGYGGVGFYVLVSTGGTVVDSEVVGPAVGGFTICVADEDPGSVI